jgi:uncharacterized protein
MQYIPRILESAIKKASRAFPAILLTGPRRSGKTTLLRKAFPGAGYYLLEDPDLIARFRGDPRGFLDECKMPAILDEVQNVPEVLNYVRSRIDGDPGKKGRWLLTGSQEAPLMRGISESMAGRAAVFQLLPLSLEETQKLTLVKGGFPEVIAKPSLSAIWFRSYIQTYLERDVRAVTQIHDIATFRRFLMILASRCGQILNKTDVAAPLGVSVPTVASWLSILETTNQIILVPPFYENFGKRLIKSPKIYFVDTGLLCHLLGIENERTLGKTTFMGPLFENYVAGEILKHQINNGKEKQLYYFRDQQGLEVDFLIPSTGGRLLLAEAKASKTVFPSMADSMGKLMKNFPENQGKNAYVIFNNPGTGQEKSHALVPGVKALALRDFLKDAL